MKYLSLLVFCVGCGATGSTLSAVEELALSATTGAEEALSGGTMSPVAIPASERPDPFRTCDAEGSFTTLFERYDADSDGRLDTPESDTVLDARADRGPDDQRMVMAQWALLVAVYDTTADGTIDDAERAVLFEDFTLRCEAIQAKLLADFDADGDGELSESEQETARAAIEADMASHHPPEGDSGAHPEGMGGPGGGAPGESGGPPKLGGEGAPPIPPPLLDEFDADGDGALSASETATMQEAMRARIRSGEPLCGM